MGSLVAHAIEPHHAYAQITNIPGSSNESGGSAGLSRGRQSFAIGEGSATNYSWYSYASGYRALTSGEYSKALDFKADARLKWSQAFGTAAVSGGTGSIALGTDSSAAEEFSKSLGFQSKATGDLSVAIRSSANASGISSMTIGTASKASGESAQATGFKTEASGK